MGLGAFTAPAVTTTASKHSDRPVAARLEAFFQLVPTYRVGKLVAATDYLGVCNNGRFAAHFHSPGRNPRNLGNPRYALADAVLLLPFPEATKKRSHSFRLLAKQTDQEIRARIPFQCSFLYEKPCFKPAAVEKSVFFYDGTRLKK